MGIYAACKALVIGVGRHADPQYDLSYARSDAEAMAELLRGEFGFDQIWALYDNDATRQNLIRFFEQDLQRTEEDDGLLIFFAGHGITVTSAIGDERGFLVPHDGNPKQPYANLSLTTIRDDYLPMIPAKHVFLIVDSCYGGLALRDVATVERPKTIDDVVLAELTRRDRKVRQVLAAGTKDQKVLDGGLFGHSVFTGRLIEALREASPYITADHVGVNVRERVARDAIDRKHLQTPQFGYLIGGNGSFVFSRRGGIQLPQARTMAETSLPMGIEPLAAEAVESPAKDNRKQENTDCQEKAYDVRSWGGLLSQEDWRAGLELTHLGGVFLVGSAAFLGVSGLVLATMPILVFWFLFLNFYLWRNTARRNMHYLEEAKRALACGDLYATLSALASLSDGRDGIQAGELTGLCLRAADMAKESGNLRLIVRFEDMSRPSYREDDTNQERSDGEEHE
jgi:hypothetical protein